MGRMSFKNRIRKIIQFEEIALLLALIAICVALSILTPAFVSRTNIMNILRQVSLTAITGFGMAMLILLGEIDLSVGSSQALVAILAIRILNSTGSVALGICSGLLLGGLIGFINGLLTVKGKLTSFIVTLGMMSIIRGAGMVVTNAKSIRIEVAGFSKLGTGYLATIPIPVIIMVVLFILVNYILTKTSFGREIYAVGGNKEAAKLAGLRVDSIRMTVFVISGVLTALSAIILAGRVDSAQPNAGQGFEMKVVSAVVLGGISMAGGIGKLTGAMIGMLILGVLSNGLTLLQVSSFWQDICTGAITILAVFMDVRRRENALHKLNRLSVDGKQEGK